MKLQLWKFGAGPRAIQPNGLSKESVVALFIHGCFQFGASMSGLFLNLYLWRLTESLTINGLFNLIVYFVTPIAFALGGWIAKKKDRMVTYRLGIVCIAVFYLIVIIAQEHVVEYYPLFAAFNGAALGLYWTGYLVLMYDVTNGRNRGRFLAINMIVFNGAGLAGPALSGYLISQFEGLRGYIVTFSVACAMFAVASLFSTRIRRIESHHHSFYLRFSGEIMKRDRTWMKALLSFFILGVFQGSMLFLPNILLYRTFGREDVVGLMAVLFAFLTIATGFYISRRKDRSAVRRDVLVPTVFVCAAACLLLADVSKLTVTVFMVVFSLFNPLTINTLTSYYYRLMDGLPLKGQFRIESVVVRELFLNAGRVLSIGLLIIFADDPEAPSLPYVLVATALTQFAMVGLVRRRMSL